MSRPGSRLRGFAAQVCCPETMSRVIDPMIADLQLEHRLAVQRGRTCRSRGLHVAAWFAFLKVMTICAWHDGLSPAGWSTDDRKTLLRVLAMSSVLIVVLTGLLELPFVGIYSRVLRTVSPKRFLYLAPQG